MEASRFPWEVMVEANRFLREVMVEASLILWFVQS